MCAGGGQCNFGSVQVKLVVCGTAIWNCNQIFVRDPRFCSSCRFRCRKRLQRQNLTMQSPRWRQSPSSRRHQSQPLMTLQQKCQTIQRHWETSATADWWRVSESKTTRRRLANRPVADNCDECPIEAAQTIWRIAHRVIGRHFEGRCIVREVPGSKDTKDDIFAIDDLTSPDAPDENATAPPTQHAPGATALVIMASRSQS